MHTSRQCQGAEPAEREMNSFPGGGTSGTQRQVFRSSCPTIAPFQCGRACRTISRAVLASMAPSPNRVNMNRALCSPSVAQLFALLASLCSTGLWKLGSCFERLLDVRTHDAAHYNSKYFNRDGAICVAYGIASKVTAATLESTGIQYLKYTLRVGVNSMHGRFGGAVCQRALLWCHFSHAACCCDAKLVAVVHLE